LAALGAAWYAVHKAMPDVLGRLDLDLPAGHTHHLSAAQRLAGDTLIALGPRPARKWAGLGLAAGTVAAVVKALDGAGETRSAGSLAASAVAVVGHAVMLAAFRRPERPLPETLPLVVRSWGIGALVGGALALALGARRARG
jgi:hypothetical protein